MCALLATLCAVVPSTSTTECIMGLVYPATLSWGAKERTGECLQEKWGESKEPMSCVHPSFKPAAFELISVLII